MQKQKDAASSCLYFSCFFLSQEMYCNDWGMLPISFTGLLLVQVGFRERRWFLQANYNICTHPCLKEWFHCYQTRTVALQSMYIVHVSTRRGSFSAHAFLFDADMNGKPIPQSPRPYVICSAAIRLKLMHIEPNKHPNKNRYLLKTLNPEP